MKFSLAILCLVIGFQSKAQHTIYGLVVDADKGTPLPYANVYLDGNSSKGTVTNSEGHFFIHFSNNPPYRIAVSFIGYDKKIINIQSHEASQLITIRLKENKKILNEVIIMPDDAMRALLAKAFSNINSNYSQSGMLLKGFYRETNQIMPEEKFIYFSESTIEYYLPSYQNSHFGPVKILKGGKAELKTRSNYSKTFFYAGPYIPQRLDFVKLKEEFINPKDYDSYQYRLVSETSYDGRDVYEISFSPRQNAVFKGTFYLDKETLAYVECHYELSDHGLQKWNRSFLSGFEFQHRKFTVKYKKNENTWSLCVAVQDGIGEEKRNGNNKIRYTNEYVTWFANEVAENPIKESEAIPYSGIYTNMENKFSDNYWKDSAEMIRPEKLENTIGFLFNEEIKSKASASINSENDSPVLLSKKEKQRKRSPFSKISSGFFLGMAPVSVVPGLYQLSYKNHFSTEKMISKSDFIPIIGYDISYDLSRHFVISLIQSNNLNSKVKFLNTFLNFRWNFHFAGWKRPFYVQPGMGISFINVRSEFGDKTSTESFTLNGIEINASQISAGVGERKASIMPTVQVIYKFRSVLSLFFEMGSSIKSWSKERIFISEASGFFLTRKSVSTPMNSEGFQLVRNSVEQISSNTHVRELNLFINLGIKVGVK